MSILRRPPSIPNPTPTLPLRLIMKILLIFISPLTFRNIHPFLDIHHANEPVVLALEFFDKEQEQLYESESESQSNRMLLDESQFYHLQEKELLNKEQLSLEEQLQLDYQLLHHVRYRRKLTIKEKVYQRRLTIRPPLVMLKSTESERNAEGDRRDAIAAQGPDKIHDAYESNVKFKDGLTDEIKKRKKARGCIKGCTQFLIAAMVIGGLIGGVMSLMGINVFCFHAETGGEAASNQGCGFALGIIIYIFGAIFSGLYYFDPLGIRAKYLDEKEGETSEDIKRLQENHKHKPASPLLQMDRQGVVTERQVSGDGIGKGNSIFAKMAGHVGDDAEMSEFSSRTSSSSYSAGSGTSSSESGSLSSSASNSESSGASSLAYGI